MIENALPGTLVMLCVEHIEVLTSLLKLMQKQENGKRVKPARKVIHLKKDLPVELNML